MNAKIRTAMAALSVASAMLFAMPSSVSAQNDARVLLNPRNDGERRLSALWEQALHALDDAQEAVDHCNRDALEQAKAQLERVEQESQNQFRAAEAAGKFREFDPRLALWVHDRTAEFLYSVRNYEVRNCPGEKRESVRTSPDTPTPKAGEGEFQLPGSNFRTYRPPQASPAAQEQFRQEIEAEFSNVQDARARQDCKAWGDALARIEALLNDYRSNVTGAASPAMRVIWADRFARERNRRPTCSELPPAQSNEGTSQQNPGREEANRDRGQTPAEPRNSAAPDHNPHKPKS